MSAEPIVAEPAVEIEGAEVAANGKTKKVKAQKPAELVVPEGYITPQEAIKLPEFENLLPKDLRRAARGHAFNSMKVGSRVLFDKKTLLEWPAKRDAAKAAKAAEKAAASAKKATETAAPEGAEIES